LKVVLNSLSMGTFAAPRLLSPTNYRVHMPALKRQRKYLPLIKPWLFSFMINAR
jgi:hypothetical protein